MSLDRSTDSPRRKVIAAWLFVVAGMIVIMIVLGGVTRLIHAGLSMVEWQPVTGWLPPMDAAQWEDAFARYRAYPEYRKLNLGMTLAEFKSIYWLEYAHRIWGRLIGVAFLVPLVIFLAKGWIDRRLAPRLVALFVLGGLQGVLGWYMVKSGLVSHPDVSQYRLAAHLGLALVILCWMLWMALGLIARPPPPAEGGVAIEAGRFRRWALAVTALVFATALSGALVAGLDAGFTYNTFPLMDGRLVPDGLLDMSPAYLNLFENIATVQFDHRVLAIATLAAVAAFWWGARRATLAAGQRRAVNALAAATAVQVGLGIATLLLVVPVPLAVLHQLGAVALLGTAVWLVHELRPGRE